MKNAHKDMVQKASALTKEGQDGLLTKYKDLDSASTN